MVSRSIESKFFHKFHGMVSSPHPFLASSVGMLTLTLVLYGLHIPNSNLILMICMMAFTFVYGLATGVICYLLMVIQSMYYFSIRHTMILFHPGEAKKLAGLLMITLFALMLTYYGRCQVLGTLHRLQEANRKLMDENALLRRQSYHDALTTLQNRFALERDLLSITEKNLMVMLIDVDNFKTINDQYGHDMGDQILTLLGRVLKSTFGEDNCYRYGGDEFLVLLQDQEKSQYAFYAKDLLSSFQRDLLTRDLPSTSLSCGYTYAGTGEEKDVPLMISLADSLLYKAKIQGKNIIKGQCFSRSLALSLKENGKR